MNYPQEMRSEFYNYLITKNIFFFFQNEQVHTHTYAKYIHKNIFQYICITKT